MEITRALPVDLEPVGDGWTVAGIAMPYGREQQVSDDGVSSYLEEIVYGAFERDCKGAPWGWVQLRLGHGDSSRDRFLGRCVGLQERPDGLWGEFRLNRDHPLAEAARSGELTGWSVSAKPDRSRQVQRPGRVVMLRELLTLQHVAATAVPQYAGAGVAVVRDHVQIPLPATPRLDAWRSKLAASTVRRHPA